MAETAALVLALEARFDKFEKQMKQLGEVVEKSAKSIEDRFTSAMKAVNDRLASMAQSMAGNIGIFGTVLQRLGPAGFAAAVGIGAVAEALNATAAAAQRVGERAIALKEFSIATGLSIQAAFGLRKALSEIGLDADDAEKAMQKFIKDLEELKREGRGPLAGLNADLVQALIRAKDASAGIELFIRALARMPKTQAVAIAREIGGRQASTFLQMTQDVEKFFSTWEREAGKAPSAEGIDKTVAATRELQRLEKAFSVQWDKLFPTESFVDAQTRRMNVWLGILKAINEEGKAAAAAKWWQSTALAGGLQEFFGIKTGAKGFIGERPRPAEIPAPGVSEDEATAKRLTAALNEQREALVKLRQEQETAKVKYKELTEQQNAAEVEAGKNIRGAANRARGIARERSELLEAYDERRKKITEVEAAEKQLAAEAEAANAKTVKSVEVANTAEERRLEILKQEEARLTGLIVKLEQRAKLGALSPAEAAELERLQRAREVVRQGQAPEVVETANRATARQNELLRAQTLAIRERLGVATEAQMRLVADAEIERAIAEGRISRTEKEIAQALLYKQIREKIAEQNVKASNLPQLTRMAEDSKDLAKQIDTLAVSSFRSFESNMADAILGMKSFKDAWQDLGRTILQTLIKISLQTALTGPLNTILGGLVPKLPGMQAGGPVRPGQAYIVGEGGREIFVPDTRGRIVPADAHVRQAPGQPAGMTVGGTNIVINGNVGDRELEQIQAALVAHERKIAATQRAMISQTRFQTSGVF